MNRRRLLALEKAVHRRAAPRQKLGTVAPADTSRLLEIIAAWDRDPDRPTPDLDGEAERDYWLNREAWTAFVRDMREQAARPASPGA